MIESQVYWFVTHTVQAVNSCYAIWQRLFLSTVNTLHRDINSNMQKNCIFVVKYFLRELHTRKRYMAIVQVNLC